MNCVRRKDGFLPCRSCCREAVVRHGARGSGRLVGAGAAVSASVKVTEEVLKGVVAAVILAVLITAGACLLLVGLLVRGYGVPGDLHRRLLAFPVNGEGRGVAGGILLLHGSEVFHAGNVGVIHLDDDVAHLQSGLVGSAAFLHGVDKHAAVHVVAVLGRPSG